MEKVRWFSHFNAVYQFINSLSYNWPGAIDRLNHLLNCSASYNALVPFAYWVFWYLLMMASKSSNFLDGLEFYFITKKLDEVQRFEGSVSDRSNENTTHARAFFSWSRLSFRPAFFPFHTDTEKVRLMSIDWFPACIAERKSYPWHNSRKSKRHFSVIADNMGVLGKRVTGWRKRNLQVPHSSLRSMETS